MGIAFLVTGGGRPSTGSPMTLRMRPRHSGPTGIAMGAPVSRTSIPRTRPSELSIATVRTVFSPRCCATSSVRLSLLDEMPGLVTFSAFRILGSFPASNSTSTTGPMTCTTLPLLLVSDGDEYEVVMGRGGSREVEMRVVWPSGRRRAASTIGGGNASMRVVQYPVGPGREEGHHAASRARARARARHVIHPP